MRAFALSFAALSLTAAPSAQAQAPRRIVSLNLCADQLVLALADRSQIAALSPLARDPDMSAEAARAKGLRLTRPGVEDVLALSPDLLITDPFANPALTSRHRTLALPSAESYGAILEQIRQVARAVGHPKRGEAMIAAMNRDLAAIRPVPGAPVAAYYQRRGYMTGTGTLVDELMRRVGLRNLAEKLRKPSLARLTVEEMVVARPDYLIVETATDTVTDQGTEMLHHPALARIPRLRLPQAWTVCGGPAYVRAARSLTAQLRARR